MQLVVLVVWEFVVMNENEPWYGKMMECDRCARLDRETKRYRIIVHVSQAIAGLMIVAFVVFTPRWF